MPRTPMRDQKEKKNKKNTPSSMDNRIGDTPWTRDGIMYRHRRQAKQKPKEASRK